MNIRADNPSPTIDLIFRKLFGSEENKDLLISLINAIVEERLQVSDVIIRNPFNLAAYLGSKESIVDVKAKDRNGNWFGLEMQVISQIAYGKRALYYVSKGYVDQLGTGQHYTTLNASIGIHILGFTIFPDDRPVHQVVFKDKQTNDEIDELQDIQLYFLEMPKFQKAWSEIVTDCDRWLAFFTHGEELRRENLPITLRATPPFARAVGELERMGIDPALREIYEAEEKARMVDAAELQYAERRGIERGIEQGTQRQRQMLYRLLTRQIGDAPAQFSARLNGLTPDQLDELGDALFDFHSYTDVETWFAGH